MNKRVWMAGLLGGLAMFLWTFIAHMALPLGEAGVRQIDNEQPLLTAMQATLPGKGMYLFPKMAPGASETQYNEQVANGPSGMLIYHPRRSFSFGAALATEFGTEFLVALVAAFLLSRTNISTFAGRVGFYALMGLAVAVSTSVSYWNWYAFPGTYTASFVFTTWMGLVCAGLVAAALKVGGSAAPVRSIAQAA